MKTIKKISAGHPTPDPDFIARINGDFLFFRTLLVLMALLCLAGLFFFFFGYPQ